MKEIVMSLTMQKIFARLIVLVMGFLAIFTGGNMNNINLELKHEVTTKTEMIEIDVLNYTGKNITTDEQFLLEKKENEQWTKVDFSENYFFKDIAVVINNFQTITFKINVIEAFGKTLDEGEYRLLKTFGEATNCSLTFTINA